MRKLAFLIIGVVVLTGVSSSSQPPNFPEEEAAYQQALQYIDQHRKSDVSIQVVDQAGAPIKGASVSYQQTSHDFLFGIFGSPGWATPDDNDARGWSLYSKLCTASETVVLDWELWSAIEPERGVFQWDQADQWFERILNRCPAARFILMFDDLACCNVDHKDPAWVGIHDLADPAVFTQFKQDLYGYVQAVVKRYAGKVAWWMTESELNLEVAWGLLRSVEKAIEVDQVVVQAIREAQPDAKVLLMAGYIPYQLPDVSISPLEFAQKALASGIQADGFSIEAYPEPGQPPLFYRDYSQTLSSLGKPVFIQETGYPSQPCAPCDYRSWTAWNGVFDEPTQAAWVKYMTAIPFGTANVMGVINFADDMRVPSSLFRDFGLFTRDGRTKQAYDMYLQQIKMFTTTGSGSTDDTGKLAFRGFAGEYTVTVTAPDGRKVEQTVHVEENGQNNFKITLK